MKILSLQALRFWAALAVVYLHAANTVGFFVPGSMGEANARLFGRCGVDVFFVLSGVIITLTSRGLTPGEFITRRARRILPLYLPMAALALAAAVITHGAGWRDALAGLTLWPATDRITAPQLIVAWSLCFEVLFYAAAALVLWRPKALPFVLIGYAGALASRSGPLLQFLGNPMILEFLMGAVIAKLPPWKPAIALVPIGVVLLYLLSPWAGHSAVVPQDLIAGVEAWRRVLFLGLPAALLVWGAMQIEARPSVFTRLGDTSYALYLVHPSVVTGVVFGLARFHQLPPSALVLLAMAASVVVSWRVYELFERPMLNWLRRPALEALAA